MAKYKYYNSDPIWGINNPSVKIWATSKTVYDRYIKDVKDRYHSLCENNKQLLYRKISWIQIANRSVTYYYQDYTFELKMILVGENHFVFAGNSISTSQLVKTQ